MDLEMNTMTQSAKTSTGDRTEKVEKSPSIRAAMIGLVGTILTVCGGLTGALISGAVTIYRVERETQQIGIAAPESRQELAFDAGQVFITRQQAAALDPETYFVDLNHGVAIRRPLNGWGELEAMTLGEQMAELGMEVSDLPLMEQPVYRIAYGETIAVTMDRQTLVDGQPLPDDVVQTLDATYGSAPWRVPYQSMIIINVYDRELVEESGFVTSLADMMMNTYHFSGGRVNELVAPEGGDFILMQSTATMTNVRLENGTTTLTIERWFLFAQTQDSYYVVEVVYMPQSGQPVRVWDDLQLYLDSFRIVRH